MPALRRWSRTVRSSACSSTSRSRIAALPKLLPAGWEPAVATQGPAKDCNIRLIFIDRVDVTGADNVPKTSSQLVYLAVPVKQTGTATPGR